MERQFSALLQLGVCLSELVDFIVELINLVMEPVDFGSEFISGIVPPVIEHLLKVVL